MSWIQLSVIAARDRVDAVGECLEARGAVAVTLCGDDDQELLEPAPGAQPLWHRVRLQALLDPGTDLDGLRGALAAAGGSLTDVDFVGDEDWQSRWRNHAVRAGFGDGRLWIVPRDEPFEAAAAGAATAVLRLDPGLAFGSGSHPTTRLCLAALATLPPHGGRVLDFGCGSGVLALAACLLGAKQVVAVDHDPQALLASRDNATYNHVDAERLRIMTPEALDAREEEAFDVVVANILAGALTALAPVLTARTAPGGRLVLSGLLDSQEGMMRDAYPAYHFPAPTRESGWICLDGRRSPVGGR